MSNQVANHLRKHVKPILDNPQVKDTNVLLICRRMMESDEFLIAFAKVASELYAECEMFSAGLQATADANTVIEILLLTAEENERNSKNKDSKKKDSDD